MENKKEKYLLSSIISRNKNIVHFGSKQDSVPEEWISKAEMILKYPFSSSYKWFLSNFAGGEIGGEEIYSLYGMDFENINGGDIVAVHLLNLKNKNWDPLMVELSSTDFGEVFCFNLSSYCNNEYNIIKILGGEISVYADNIYQFIAKRIYEHGGS